MTLLFYQYGSICEPDIISGFEELGFHVDTITAEIYDKSITGERQIALICEAFSKKDYRFVFTVNFFPAISECCNIYHIPYLSLIVDSPVLELFSTSIANPWNRIFLFDHALYEEFVHFNPLCIFYLPLAVNVKRWDKILSASSNSLPKTFSSQISFVGSLYTEKCPYDDLRFPSAFVHGYIDGIIAAQAKVYGYFFLEEVLQEQMAVEIANSTPNFYRFPEKSQKNYRAVLAQYYLGTKITSMERIELLSALGRDFSVDLYSASDASSLPVHPKGRVKTHTEMPLVFHHSAINLNITAKSIRSGIPLRVWDVLGCHGFLISNYQSEIPNFLTPGEDIILYSCKEELLDLAAYYLEHPKERTEIAENGYQKVKLCHTWPIRLTQMLELAFSLPAL